jgi:hypothetical protein
MSALFRKKAVENYKDVFSTDSNITKLSTSSLFVSAILIVGVVFTALWFVFGDIVSLVKVKGIVYPTSGIENLTAEKAGIVSDVIVSKGDSVEVGDVIAIIPDNSLLEEIKTKINDGADEAEISALRQEYNDNSLIRAKSSGMILSVVNCGAYVVTGDVVATVSSRKKDENDRQILAFLPTNQKNSISVGCKVQVSPNYAPREKYGYINGYISEIDTSVVTKNDIQNSMNVYNIPTLLNDEETYIALHINLLPDENNLSGLSWSVKQSGDIDVEMGTLCEVSVVESNLPPYKWLFGGG